MAMKSGVPLVLYGDQEADIAEISPNGMYVRYHEIEVEEKGAKVGYKGFDEDYGRDVTWNKIRVTNSSKSEQLLQDLNQFLKPLKHDNIVEYYSSWLDHNTSHINLITEAFTSGCLRKYRNKYKCVETYAIKKWARQILEGLCFLHTHDPPIVHGSLTCDNIFINGNTGEVKIGDPGLENIIQDPPMELSEEEFYEDFDVYSFAICMLELATSQNPILKSESLRDIYRKKTITSTMQAVLAKVKDAQFKKFIVKCLSSRSVKLSATELLQDSFLQTPTPTTCEAQAPQGSASELRGIIRNSKFNLKGEKTLNGSVLFKLSVDNSKGKKLEIEFEFESRKETTLEVAREMIEAFDLSNEDVILVAELMDCLILRMVPCLQPSLLEPRWDLVPAF